MNLRLSIFRAATALLQPRSAGLRPGSASVTGCHRAGPEAGAPQRWSTGVACAVICGIFCLAALTTPLAAAEGTNTDRTATARQPASAPTRVDYSTFKIVTERNIFNAGRSGRAPMNSRETRRPTRVESVGLVGTLENEKGPVAFFDGSSSEYRKALKQDAVIAGWKLTAVSLQGVKLTLGTNSLELKVGMSLRREDEGEWKLASTGESISGSSGGSVATSGGFREASSPAASAPSGAAAEILRRMAERKAKEEQ